MPIINRIADFQDEVTAWRRDLHRRLKIAAAEDEREMSDITSRALKRFLDDRDRRRSG